MRSPLRRAWSAYLIAAVVAACGAAHASAAAADGLSWASGATVPPPANAGSQPGVVITSIACPTAGDCSAVGSYTDSSGDTQGLVAVESGGHWNASSTAKLPSNINAVNPEVSLTSVACASVGNCTAVGSFLDVNGLTQGLLLTETGGTWGTGREVIHPLSVPVSGNPQIDLTAVSCASATNCFAAGTYNDNYGRPQGLLETEINGTWSYTVTNGVRSYTGSEAGLPSDAATHPNVAINSVSCGAVGRCVAVGSYVNTANEQEALLLTGSDSSGAWVFTPSAASLPSGAATSPVAALDSVSCKATGECDAVGSYEDSSHHAQGLLLTQTGSAWQQGSKALLPADASGNPDVSLTSVSCWSVGNCDAVGNYYSGAGNANGLMLTATSGTWGTGAEPTIPADAGSGSFATLSSVSCSGTFECAATGNYLDDSFSTHPLVLSQSSTGAWSAGIEPALPYPSASPDANTEAVACAAGGDCTAVADYSDEAGNQLAAAVNGTGTAGADPTLSLIAPPTLSETGIALPASDFSAALSGGSGESGQLTFSVFGPQDSAPLSCAWGGTQFGAVTVSGDGSRTPAQGFTPAAAGDYWWYASYGGDLGNGPAVSACGPAMAVTVVQTPALSIGAPPAAAPNATISPSAIGATLSDAAIGAGGTVTFTVFGPEPAAPADCSAGGSQVGSATVQGNGTLNPGGGFTPGQVGDYWWYASYTGDGSDPAATSGCGTQMAETVVKAGPTLRLSAAAATGTVGQPVGSPISAELAGGVNETGTVTFSVYGPQPSPPTACGSPTATVGSAAVHADGTYAPASFTPKAAGSYWWYASYGGDAGNDAAASACGAQMPVTVVSSPKTTTTPTTTRPVATARIAKVAAEGKLLKVTITCKATSHQSCAGVLRATTTEPRSGKTTRSARVVTIAKLTFSVGGGKSREVSTRLNRVGVNLLTSHRKLSALLELLQKRTTPSRTVTLRLPAVAKHRRMA